MIEVLSGRALMHTSKEAIYLPLERCGALVKAWAGCWSMANLLQVLPTTV